MLRECLFSWLLARVRCLPRAFVLTILSAWSPRWPTRWLLSPRKKSHSPSPASRLLWPKELLPMLTAYFTGFQIAPNVSEFRVDQPHNWPDTSVPRFRGGSAEQPDRRLYTWSTGHSPTTVSKFLRSFIFCLPWGLEFSEMILVSTHIH